MKRALVLPVSSVMKAYASDAPIYRALKVFSVMTVVSVFWLQNAKVLMTVRSASSVKKVAVYHPQGVMTMMIVLLDLDVMRGCV